MGNTDTRDVVYSALHRSSITHSIFSRGHKRLYRTVRCFSAKYLRAKALAVSFIYVSSRRYWAPLRKHGTTVYSGRQRRGESRHQEICFLIYCKWNCGRHCPSILTESILTSHWSFRCRRRNHGRLLGHVPVTYPNGHLVQAVFLRIKWFRNLVIYNVLMSLTGIGNVAWYCHLGGFIIGQSCLAYRRIRNLSMPRPKPLRHP